MSVYSVNVYPSSTTIKTGNWYYGAYAVVNASSNCNTGVTWYQSGITDQYYDLNSDIVQEQILYHGQK